MRLIWLTLLLVGLILFSAHLGVFVFLYLPACVIVSIILILRSRRLKDKKGKSESLREEAQSLTESIQRFFSTGEYSLTKGELALRKILGLSCFSWFIGFTIMAFLIAGKYALMPFIIVVFMSPLSLFILPSLIVGLYQLRVKKGNRKMSLLMLIFGIVMSALVFIFFMSSTYMDERGRYLFGVTAVSSLLILLNGLTCVERKPKKLLIFAIITACLTVYTIFCTIMFQLYGWNTFVMHSGFLQFLMFTPLLALIVAIGTILIDRKKGYR